MATFTFTPYTGIYRNRLLDSGYFVGLPALSTISGDASNNTNYPGGTVTTSAPYTTAFLTSLTLTEARNGALIWKSNGSFYRFDGNVNAKPFKLEKDGAVLTSFDYGVSATGNACAEGWQYATLNIYLSSQALSGSKTNGTGTVSAISVDVNPITYTFRVSAIDTPYIAGLIDYCAGERRRIIQAVGL